MKKNFDSIRRSPSGMRLKLVNRQLRAASAAGASAAAAALAAFVFAVLPPLPGMGVIAAVAEGLQAASSFA